jgi:poly(3-hydroxybutyrate) depolymerase
MVDSRRAASRAVPGLLGVVLVLSCSRGQRARLERPLTAEPAASDPALNVQKPAPRPSAGCGKHGTLGELSLHASDGSGRSRDFRLYVPASYDAQRPRALVFVYHGASATEDTAAAYGIQTLPDAATKALFVFPQGIPFGRNGVGWNDTCAGYDMVFFDHMLAALKADYCIDEARVFAAGFSWGGDQVTALACCRGANVRAIAAAGCTDEFTNPNDPRSYQNLPCATPGATAVRFTHDSDGDEALSADLFRSTSALYRDLNGCTDAVSATGGACRSYAGCKEPVLECGYPHLGHALPRSWSRDTWNFFARF